MFAKVIHAHASRECISFSNDASFCDAHCEVSEALQECAAGCAHYSETAQPTHGCGSNCAANAPQAALGDSILEPLSVGMAIAPPILTEPP